MRYATKWIRESTRIADSERPKLNGCLPEKTCCRRAFQVGVCRMLFRQVLFH